jgi:hypothetical protein
MRPQAGSACGLKLLVYEGLKLLVYEATRTYVSIRKYLQDSGAPHARSSLRTAAPVRRGFKINIIEETLSNQSSFFVLGLYNGPDRLNNPDGFQPHFYRAMPTERSPADPCLLMLCSS